ncbi:MAG TPA: phosphoribosylamine--glycine ligase [Bacteroidales bacterium]|nr:phosphoribosylamine--glycine ligase [Bacteroidales bacterium]
MNILLLGSGGREHAFAWKLSQSPLLDKLYIAPGNAGTASCGENIDCSPLDFEKIALFVKEKQIGLVLVGPEDPLVQGIYDYFQAHEELKNIPVIGPSQKGAQLEGSKDFAKVFMQKYNIPTAAYRTFTRETLQEGFSFIDTLKPPYVLKADGLAAGKGVAILNNTGDAKAELEQMLAGSKFGKASEKVVIEEFLKGIELSVFVLTDGQHYQVLPVAKDYKKIGEGDTGPNTGGMGAVSGVPFADDAFMEKVHERIIKPTIQGLQQEKITYKGFIFMGLMNVGGDPYVIEYNVRMGDPETESVLPRIKNDLVELLLATAGGTLHTKKMKIDDRYTVTVMMVSEGYPGSYQKGKKIAGLNTLDGSIVFHAGTAVDAEGNIITNGGRVLGVMSFGDTLTEAREKSYKNTAIIDFEGMYYRHDIGNDLM